METGKKITLYDLLGKIGAGAGSLAAIGVVINWIYKNEITWARIEWFTTRLNFLVVLIFRLIAIRTPKLEFSGPYSDKDGKLLISVNKLMKQLNINILLYAGSLIAVYLFYFLQSNIT